MPPSAGPLDGQSGGPYLSVVLPCYNGQHYVAASLRSLLAFLGDNKQSIPSWEIILVDDGSTDETAHIVATSFPEVRLIRNERNRGKGLSVRRGMLAARGEFCAFIDADMPFDLSALNTMLRYLDFKEFDVCIGTRSLANVEARVRRRWLRKLASTVFTALISRLVVTGIRDTQCGMKAFRRDVGRYLFGESRIAGFASDVEILYLAYKNDFDVKRLPVTLVADEYSSVSVWKHSLPMLVSVLSIPWRWYTGKYRLYEQSQTALANGPES